MKHISFSLSIVLLVSFASAACQVRGGDAGATLDKYYFDIDNGQMASATLSVTNQLMFSSVTLYINGKRENTIPERTTFRLVIPVYAPAWGSGSGTTTLPLDVMVVGESKCWDSTISIRINHHPGQAEISAIQAAQQAEQAKQQQTSSGIFNIFVIGLLVLLIFGVGVVAYYMRKQSKRNRHRTEKPD